MARQLLFHPYHIQTSFQFFWRSRRFNFAAHRPPTDEIGRDRYTPIDPSPTKHTGGTRSGLSNSHHHHSMAPPAAQPSFMAGTLGLRPLGLILWHLITYILAGVCNVLLPWRRAAARSSTQSTASVPSAVITGADIGIGRELALHLAHKVCVLSHVPAAQAGSHPCCLHAAIAPAAACRTELACCPLLPARRAGGCMQVLSHSRLCRSCRHCMQASRHCQWTSPSESRALTSITP